MRSLSGDSSFRGAAARLLLPHFGLILTQLFFSGWHIIGSAALKDGANALVFALYREIFASIMMGILVIIRLDRRSPQYAAIYAYRLRLLFLGVCSFFNVVGTVVALKYISPTRYSIFQPSIPCIASVISCIVGLERVTVLKVVGILFAVAGAVVIEAWHSVVVEVDVGAEEANVPLGLSIVIMQVFAMANVIVFQKELVMKFDPSLVAFSYYTIGTAITIILCTVLHNQFSWSDFLFHGHLLPWLGLAYAAIFATLFAYNAYAWAGKILRPSVTTIYCTLQPVGTAVLSLFFLHQSPEVGELIGGIGVILGLFVTVYGNRDEERRQLLMMSIDHKSDSDSDSDLGAMAMAVDAHYSALKGASDCDNDHSDVATTDERS